MWREESNATDLLVEPPPANRVKSFQCYRRSECEQSADDQDVVKAVKGKAAQCQAWPEQRLKSRVSANRLFDHRVSLGHTACNPRI